MLEKTLENTTDSKWITEQMSQRSHSRHKQPGSNYSSLDTLYEDSAPWRKRECLVKHWERWKERRKEKRDTNSRRGRVD